MTERNRRELILHTLVPSLATAAIAGAATPAYAAGGTPPTINLNNFVSAADFGAVGNGMTDDTNALQAAIHYCHIHQRSLYIKAGTYLVSASLLKDQSFAMFNIVGDGADNTVIKSTSGSVSSIFKIKGGSGNNVIASIRHITFQGSLNNIAVEVADQCNLTFEYCKFTDAAVGLCLHNENGFTEYVRASACYFSQTCLLPMELKRSAGHGSFHGCGIVGRSVIDSPTSPSSVVRIGANCLLYNAEFNAQIFSHSTLTVFENLSTLPSYAFGNLTLEPQHPGGITLAVNRRLPFAGTISGITSDKIKFGSLFVCQTVFLDAGSATSFTGARYSNRVVATQNNVLPSPINGCVRQVFLNITAPNYVYRTILIVEHNGYGNAGKFTAIHIGYLFNGAGYGAPTFAVDSYAQLVVDNLNYPANLVSITYEETQLSQVINGAFVGA